jgi:hypothetical protein
MCDTIASASEDIEAEVRAGAAEAELTTELLLTQYITILAIAKRKGYNGFSDEVSRRFLGIQKHNQNLINSQG